MLVGCATAASLFPFVGTIVYMIVRPPEYLDDVRERELEMQAAEARLARARATMLCPHCDHAVEKDFLRCPSCLRKLKDPCAHCAQPARPAVEDLPVLRDGGPGRDQPPPRRRAARGARSRRRPTTPAPVETPRVLTPPDRRSTAMDRTLILVKPDAFARGLTGEIIARFERKGLRIVALQAHAARRGDRPRSTTPSTRASRSSASSSTSSPPARSSRSCSRATRPSRPRARSSARRTRSRRRTGSIRGDFAIEVGQNMVHGSDSHRVGRARGQALLPEPLSMPRLDVGSRLSVLGARVASPQRRAILEQLGVRRSRSCRRMSRRTTMRRAGRRRTRRTRCARRTRPRPRRRRRRRRVLGVDTRRRARRRDLRQAGRRGRGRARRCDALAGRTHEVVSGLASSDDGDAQPASAARASRSATLDDATSTGTSPPASGASRAGGYAIQGRGAALVERDRGRLPQRRRAAGRGAARAAGRS